MSSTDTPDFDAADADRRPVKAYRNLEFLTGEHARTLRILAEYLEPDERLERLGVRNSLVLFGSARLKRLAPGQAGPDYYADAARIGELLARWTLETHPPEERYHLFTGGGPGLMEAVHEGSAPIDRVLNVGLNISLPFEQHVNPHVDLERAFEFHYFFMRKLWFLSRARGVVAFPGGFGTLDELFEVLTLVQTGKVARLPMVLYGREFWDEIVDWPALVRRGLISDTDLKLFRYADTPEEAVRLLTMSLETWDGPEPGTDPAPPGLI